MFEAKYSFGRGLFSEDNVMDALEICIPSIVTHLKISSSVHCRIIPMILQNVGLSKEKKIVVWVPR